VTPPLTYPISLHDALPISFGADSVLSDSMMATVIAARLAKTRVVTVLNQLRLESSRRTPQVAASMISAGTVSIGAALWNLSDARSEEHTSELQSRENLVCR